MWWEVPMLRIQPTMESAWFLTAFPGLRTLHEIKKVWKTVKKKIELELSKTFLEFWYIGATLRSMQRMENGSLLLCIYVSKVGLLLLAFWRESPLWKQHLQLLQEELSSKKIDGKYCISFNGFRPWREENTAIPTFYLDCFLPPNHTAILHG